MADSTTTDQQPPEGGGQDPGRSLLRILRPAVLLVLLVIALAGLAWLLAAPRGELRLALDSSVQNEQEKARVAAQLFRLTDSQVDEAQRYHSRLSLRDHNAARPLVPMPPTETPGGHSLQSLITSFLVETSIDEETGRIALSIDGVALLEALYGAVGWTDYFLSISGIEELQCPDAKCYRVFAHFSPSDLRTEVFEGTIEEIARNLAVLVVTGVVRRTGDLWEIEPENAQKEQPYIFAASVPGRMKALEDTATGIEILQDGTGHPTCQSLSAAECLLEARGRFERALDEKQGGVRNNPLAAFGLALIATQEGFSNAATLKPDRAVEAKLQRASRLMKRARKSRFLREQLARSEFASQFDALQLGGLVLDKTFFDDVGKFVCTLESFRLGDWRGCLDQVGDIDAYPEPLKPYLEAATFYAELMELETAEERAASIMRVRQRIVAIDSDVQLRLREKSRRKWPLQRVLVLNACIYPESTSEEVFRADADNFVDSAPDLDARRIAQVEVAGCRVGDMVMPDDNLPDVDQLVNSLDDEEARRRLELALAKYYVRVGDHASALTLLRNAIRLPHVGPYVRSAPEFEAFMESEHAEDFIVAYFKVRPHLEELACRPVEL